MFRIVLAIFFFLAAVAGVPLVANAGEQAAAQNDNVLTFAADLWCPVNCEAGTDRPGFAVELLKRIYEPLGYKINYIVMPWARAVERGGSWRNRWGCGGAQGRRTESGFSC
jgi:hypothetical protein